MNDSDCSFRLFIEPRRVTILDAILDVIRDWTREDTFKVLNFFPI